MSLKKEKFGIVRAIIYIISIVLILLVVIGKIKTSCYFKDNFGIICPACGLTRATISIINLNFYEAMQYNLFYTVVLIPLVLFLVINDVYILIKRFIFKKKGISFVEIIFGGKSNWIILR